jgi:DUF4097 and DUF4098 domain-containing protein YvlB
MPTFETPEPIFATTSLVVGNVWIIASDRRDTSVVVAPSDRSNDSDVKAAEATRVEYSHGTLVVKGPKQRPFSFWKTGSIEVTIEMPADSRLGGDVAVGDFRCDGRLGECKITAATGSIRLDQTGPLNLSTATGSITVDRAEGRAELTGAGEVRIRRIDGPATIKNLNGDTWIGEITGDFRCRAANGNVAVDRAQSSLVAKTANGDIRFRDVARGSAVLETAFGELEVGIREGTSALLDVRSGFGTVDNSLSAADGPEPSGETLEVRARTSFGDILIHRSVPEDAHGK